MLQVEVSSCLQSFWSIRATGNFYLQTQFKQILNLKHCNFVIINVVHFRILLF
jgi:hypothetical protein